MKRTAFILLAFLLFICLTSMTDTAFAKDYANFESFYKESGMWGWIIGGIIAFLGIAAVVFSGGAATPIVAGIGSAVGGMMGLSGAAATSAGLALLGGGSLAAGGFGMAGGAVLISAVLEGTVLVGSQYVDAVGRENSYQELCKQMQDYPSFPPIKNGSGPSEIGKVVKILNSDYDIQQPNSSAQNQRAIRDALYELNRYRPEEDSFYKVNYKEVIRHEQLRVNSLLAILYFMENDYKSAYSKARISLRYFNGVKDDGPASVPNFILAAAGLVTKEISPNKSVDLFSRVVDNEAESPILPLLYSIYISRAGAAEVINDDFLKNIIYSASRINNKEIKTVVDSQIMMAILARLWANQQVIITIGDNISSFNLQKAKERCRESLKEYEAVLGMAKSFRNGFPSETPDERDFLRKTSTSIQKYNDDLANLQQVVAKVESIRESQPESGIQTSDSPTGTSNTERDSIWFLLAIGAFIVILLVIKLSRKGSKSKDAVAQINGVDIKQKDKNEL